MRYLLIAAVMVVAAASAKAEVIRNPTPQQAELIYRFLAGSPPDFEALARSTAAARNASEFDRDDVVNREIQSMKDAYAGVARIDAIVLNVSGRFSEYDGANGGFNLDLFQPDIYVNFDKYGVVFDNYRDFSTWKIDRNAGRKVLDITRGSRSLVFETTVRPFAVVSTSTNQIRAQVREVKIIEPNSRTVLATLKSGEPLRAMAGTAAASPPMDTSKFTIMGLRPGADFAAFRSWITENKFSAPTIDPSILAGWKPNLIPYVTAQNFSVVTPKLSGYNETLFPDGSYGSVGMAGSGFDCGSEVDAMQTCGVVVFNDAATFDAKKIKAIRVVQNVVGATDQEIVSALVAKYGNDTDVLETFVEARSSYKGREARYRAKQYVWGAAKPYDFGKTGASQLVSGNHSWPLEIVLFRPDPMRSTAIIQLIDPALVANPAVGESGPRGLKL